MKKLVQINPVIRANTSTGKIMRGIAEAAQASGWESYVAYSGGRDPLSVDFPGKKIPVGGKLDVLLHALETRLLDRHGLSSRLATRRFVKELEALNPDLVHIHNIHGYFLNYKILCRYLADAGIPVVWTVHDCWLYTGHCYHYASAGCYRWQTVCGHCPQTHKFPSSLLLDRSAANFRDKSAAFNSLPDLTLVTVSEWMKGEMSSSFLKDHPFRVIHNGIDTDTFRPVEPSAVISRYGLEGKKILLGVCSIWLAEKGIADFISLAGKLDADEKLVLVGQMTPSQEASLPDSVLHIRRTSDASELAALYSAATALVNLTWQDNYPTVNLESIACGTPVVTYRTGGSPESVVEGETGYVAPQGDVDAVLARLREVEADGKERYTDACRSYAVARFGKEDRFEDYIELYENLTVR